MARSILFLATLLLAATSHAGLLVDFSETPQLIANGFSIQGVSFTWSNPASADVFQYGATMGTPAFGVTLLDDPVLQGAADGVLAIHFASPVTALSFALAVCCGPMTDDVGGGTTIGVDSQPVPVALIQPLQFISEGMFSYLGPSVSDVTLSFSGATMFAVDNLTFEPAAASEASEAAPEPAAGVLIGIGLCGLAFARKRAQR